MDTYDLADVGMISDANFRDLETFGLYYLTWINLVSTPLGSRPDVEPRVL